MEENPSTPEVSTVSTVSSYAKNLAFEEYVRILEESIQLRKKIEIKRAAIERYKRSLVTYRNQLCDCKDEWFSHCDKIRELFQSSLFTKKELYNYLSSTGNLEKFSKYANDRENLKDWFNKDIDY